MGKIVGVDAIPQALLACLPADGLMVQNAPGQTGGGDLISSQPGSYLLFIRILAATTIDWKTGAHTLNPGWYLYVGSAKGPGGMRARVMRHMKTDKKPHWHIDKITCQTPPVAAVCYTGQDECDLVAGLTAGPVTQGSFDVPLPGFGSSDCKKCRSHFLAWRGVG